MCLNQQGSINVSLLENQYLTIENGTIRKNGLYGEHLKQNRKDFNTERSLVKLVGKRRSLLDYLKNKDILRYRAIVKELGLRK